MVQPLLIIVFVLILTAVFIKLRGNSDRPSSLNPSKQQENNTIPDNAQTKAKPVFTEDQVSTHNTADDVWLIINGKVYDFTDYIALHPGGEALLRNAGRDSSEGFAGPQHPLRVWDMIEEFYIGDLKTSDASTNAKMLKKEA